MVDWGDKFVDKDVGGLFKVLWEVFVWRVVVMGFWRGVGWYSNFVLRVIFTS